MEDDQTQEEVLGMYEDDSFPADDSSLYHNTDQRAKYHSGLEPCAECQQSWVLEPHTGGSVGNHLW